VVTVVVHDDDTSTTRTQTVTVLTQSAAIDNIHEIVNGLQAAGKINGGIASSFHSKLDSADASISAGRFGTAVNQLEALLNQIDGLVGAGRLVALDVAPMRMEVRRVIDSIDN
jgi:hypothetical protein